MRVLSRYLNTYYSQDPSSLNFPRFPGIGDNFPGMTIWKFFYSIREGVADEFVIDYYHCRIIDIQGLISIILQ